MSWSNDTCENTDSCTEDTVHSYPAVGTIVRVPKDTMVRVQESDKQISIVSGEYKVVDVLNYSHQVGLEFGLQTVWVDVEDDIEPL